MLLTLVFAYLLVTIAIGLFAARRARNTADFAVAGRRLPLAMILITTFATWFGSETVLGIPAQDAYHRADLQRLRAWLLDSHGRHLDLRNGLGCLSDHAGGRVRAAGVRTVLAPCQYAGGAVISIAAGVLAWLLFLMTPADEVFPAQLAGFLAAAGGMVRGSLAPLRLRNSHMLAPKLVGS